MSIFSAPTSRRTFDSDPGANRDGRHRAAVPQARPRPVYGLLALALLLPLLLGAGEAGAWRGWCLRDPAFKIAGETAHVRLAVHVDSLRKARALSLDQPIGIVLTVPEGVDARFLGGDNGFGSGYDVEVKHAADLPAGGPEVPVRVAAYVPMTDSSVAVRVSFVPTMGGAVPSAPAQHGARKHSPPKAALAVATASGTANSWVTLSTAS